MKTRIEIVDGLPEEEIIIRCGSINEKVAQLQKLIQEQTSSPPILFYKENQEFYLPLTDILFFETSGESIYAHTSADAYRTRLRLYELEQLLPGYFIRAAKGSIVNTRQIHSLSRNLAGASLVQFKNTEKHVYASRHYYHALHQLLKERNFR